MANLVEVPRRTGDFVEVDLNEKTPEQIEAIKLWINFYSADLRESILNGESVERQLWFDWFKCMETLDKMTNFQAGRGGGK